MYGPTISALIRAGQCAALIDPRSGHWLDHSGNGNHATPSAGLRQAGPAQGWAIPAVTDEATIADVAGMRLTTGTLVLLLRCTSQTATEYLLGHDLAGSGFSLSLNATQLVFTGDGVARTIAATLTGKRMIAVSFVSGGTPIGYADNSGAGINLGNFSGAVTVTATATVTEIGNWNNSGQCKSLIEAAFISNAILTETQIAQVYAELAAQPWPSSQSILALARQGSPIGEAGLVAGFDLKPVGTSIPSHNGAFTGTVSGDAHYRKSILGDALQLGRTTGAVDLGVGNATINPTTDSHWVEVWARPLDVAMVDAVAPIIGKGVVGAFGRYQSFGIDHSSTTIYLAWYTNAPAQVTITGPAVRNKLTHLLYQVDRITDNAYLYVDGVQYGPVAITTLYAAQATNWIVGKNGSTAPAGDEGFGGLAVCPRIGTGVLTPAQVLARYALGARAVQFKTDWGYPVSPSDEGGVTGQQIGGHASPFRAGDATGRWRVETDTVDGKTCKAVVCKTAGWINVPASLFGMNTTPTEAAYGTWDFWAYKGADGNTLKIHFIDATIASGAGYNMELRSDESIEVNEVAVASKLRTAAAYFAINTWNRLTITRSLAGDFYAYMNRVALVAATGANPFNDTTTATSLYLAFDMDAGDKLALSDVGGGHALMKQLGVNAP